MTYRAPVADIAFTLKHAAGFAPALAEGLYGDLGEDVVDAVLAEAGRFATDVLQDVSPEVTATVELLVSELATNCIRHTDSAFDLTIIRSGREIRVEDNGGTSYTDAIFFIDNQLYQIKVTYPAVNTDPVGSSGIHFFQQAFRLLH